MAKKMTKNDLQNTTQKTKDSYFDYGILMKVITETRRAPSISYLQFHKY